MAFQNRVIPRMSMPPCSRNAIFTSLSQNMKMSFYPRIENYNFQNVIFTISLHFPEFEIVQNDILGQNVIFPKMAFCLRMSFYPRMSFGPRIGSIISPESAIKHFAPKSGILSQNRQFIISHLPQLVCLTQLRNC